MSTYAKYDPNLLAVEYNPNGTGWVTLPAASATIQHTYSPGPSGALIPESHTASITKSWVIGTNGTGGVKEGALPSSGDAVRIVYSAKTLFTGRVTTTAFSDRPGDVLGLGSDKTRQWTATASSVLAEMYDQKIIIKADVPQETARNRAVRYLPRVYTQGLIPTVVMAGISKGTETTRLDQLREVCDALGTTARVTDVNSVTLYSGDIPLPPGWAQNEAPSLYTTASIDTQAGGAVLSYSPTDVAVTGESVFKRNDARLLLSDWEMPGPLPTQLGGIGSLTSSVSITFSGKDLDISVSHIWPTIRRIRPQLYERTKGTVPSIGGTYTPGTTYPPGSLVGVDGGLFGAAFPTSTKPQKKLSGTEGGAGPWQVSLLDGGGGEVAPANAPRNRILGPYSTTPFSKNKLMTIEHEVFSLPTVTRTPDASSPTTHEFFDVTGGRVWTLADNTSGNAAGTISQIDSGLLHQMQIRYTGAAPSLQTLSTGQTVYGFSRQFTPVFDSANVFTYTGHPDNVGGVRVAKNAVVAGLFGAVFPDITDKYDGEQHSNQKLYWGNYTTQGKYRIKDREKQSIWRDIGVVGTNQNKSIVFTNYGGYVHTAISGPNTLVDTSYLTTTVSGDILPGMSIRLQYSFDGGTWITHQAQTLAGSVEWIHSADLLVPGQARHITVTAAQKLGFQMRIQVQGGYSELADWQTITEIVDESLAGTTTDIQVAALPPISKFRSLVNASQVFKTEIIPTPDRASTVLQGQLVFSAYRGALGLNDTTATRDVTNSIPDDGRLIAPTLAVGQYLHHVDITYETTLGTQYVGTWVATGFSGFNRIDVDVLYGQAIPLPGVSTYIKIVEMEYLPATNQIAIKWNGTWQPTPGYTLDLGLAHADTRAVGSLRGIVTSTWQLQTVAPPITGNVSTFAPLTTGTPLRTLTDASDKYATAVRWTNTGTGATTTVVVGNPTKFRPDDAADPWRQIL